MKNIFDEIKKNWLVKASFLNDKAAECNIRKVCVVGGLRFYVPH